MKRDRKCNKVTQDNEEIDQQSNKPDAFFRIQISFRAIMVLVIYLYCFITIIIINNIAVFFLFYYNSDASCRKGNFLLTPNFLAV